MHAGVSTKALLTDRIVLVAGIVCFAALGLIAWALFGSRDTGSPRRPAEQVYTTLVCPDCGDEIPYNQNLVGEICSACDSASGLVAVMGTPSEKSRFVWGRVLVFLVSGSILLSGLIHLVVRRRQAIGRSAEAIRNERLVCRCPYCERKIGYPTSKAGEVFLCARCKTAFMLPFLNELAEESGIEP